MPTPPVSRSIQRGATYLTPGDTWLTLSRLEWLLVLQKDFFPYEQDISFGIDLDR
jgi:hypothetical protein